MWRRYFYLAMGTLLGLVTPIVGNNQITLLQNGEAYFPAIETPLELAIKTEARRIFENTWRTQSFGMRLASWLSYGLVRFLTGMTGYAHGKQSHPNRSIARRER